MTEGELTLAGVVGALITVVVAVGLTFGPTLLKALEVVPR